MESDGIFSSKLLCVFHLNLDKDMMLENIKNLLYVYGISVHTDKTSESLFSGFYYSKNSSALYLSDEVLKSNKYLLYAVLSAIVYRNLDKVLAKLYSDRLFQIDEVKELTDVIVRSWIQKNRKYILPTDIHNNQLEDKFDSTNPQINGVSVFPSQDEEIVSSLSKDELETLIKEVWELLDSRIPSLL